MSTEVIPLDDRVLICPVAASSVSKGGIVIPENAREKPVKGRVVAVGSGRKLDNGERVPMSVSPDDVVIYSKYAGTEIKVDGVEHVIMRESDCLSVVREG